MNEAITQKDKYHLRHSQLIQERSSWMDHWSEISMYLLPRSGRFFTSDRNNGRKKQNNIYDSTGTRALRVLGAGLMGGATSPARPWFRLAIPNKDLMEYDPVRLWLSETTKIMRTLFAQANTYRALHTQYEELGAFGTSACLFTDDYDKVIHHMPLTAGEYCLATDFKGDVKTLYREFEKTVDEVVREFGLENCSLAVKNLYNNHSLESPVEIVHVIEPNKNRIITKDNNNNMKFTSVYYEKGCDTGEYLRKGGFKNFRGLCPRWHVTSSDIYGHSPGMESLGDIKQLQHEQLRKAEGIDYQTKPPLDIPSSMKNQEVNRLPGGITYSDRTGQSGGIKSMFEVNLRLDHLLADIQDVRQRIRESFYTDLFLMLASQPRTNMTATEVAERHEEKLLMLGPVLERLHNELLNPLIEMTFERVVQTGLVPPPPEELQGQELQVEFVSMLAQAQRAVATSSIDRYVMNLGQIAQYKPGVLDKFNEDKWADEYADMLGVDPEFIVPDAKVALIRKERADAQAAAAQQEQAMMAADSAAKLANAPTDSKNALTDVTRMFSGYSTPQGGA